MPGSSRVARVMPASSASRYVPLGSTARTAGEHSPDDREKGCDPDGHAQGEGEGQVGERGRGEARDAEANRGDATATGARRNGDVREQERPAFESRQGTPHSE